MISREPTEEAQPTSGLFTPRLTNDPECRLTFELSLFDIERFNRLKPGSTNSITVTDLRTGLEWHLRPADCGADCYCDAECWPTDALGDPFGNYPPDPTN